MGKKGRKEGSNGAESRANLVLIAAEEFATYGYYDTKVSTIVKKAGVTQPTFYLYFGSKEAIFSELIQKLFFRVLMWNYQEGPEPTAPHSKQITRLRGWDRLRG